MKLDILFITFVLLTIVGVLTMGNINDNKPQLNTKYDTLHINKTYEK
jgi:hypothetical protein